MAEDGCRVPDCPRLAWEDGLCGVHLRQRKRQRPLGARGTTLRPENTALLKELGITYRQWFYWHQKGWLEGGFKDVNRTKLELLTRAAKLQALPLNELADLLATKEVTSL